MQHNAKLALICGAAVLLVLLSALRYRSARQVQQRYARRRRAASQHEPAVCIESRLSTRLVRELHKQFPLSSRGSVYERVADVPFGAALLEWYTARCSAALQRRVFIVDVRVCAPHEHALVPHAPYQCTLALGERRALLYNRAGAPDAQRFHEPSAPLLVLVLDTLPRFMSPARCTSSSNSSS